MGNDFSQLGIGAGHPCFIIAEISANHNHDLDLALKIVEAAADAGADAIKLQTYTADTLTIDSDRPEFKVTGTIWEGETLYSLYQKAALPWDWHEPIFAAAKARGMRALSTPFDPSAVDFLEALDVDIFKIASSELIDIPLIAKVASTRKPVLLSTGMGTEDEIEEAVATLRDGGCPDVCILKCTAAYPSQVADANLASISLIREKFGATPGLSDHTMATTAPVVATALGAKVIEKHFTLRRSDGGPDAAFSLEPHEFAEMVKSVRDAEAALGQAVFAPTDSELRPREFRRSLYVVNDVAKGEMFTASNVRSIRPANGLHPRHYATVLGARARRAISAGTPLSEDLIEDRA